MNGWGDYSQVNFVGSVVETRPLKMQTPSFDIPTSSNTEIKVIWVPLVVGPETGGVTIDEYRVLYKADIDSVWNTLVSPTSAYTIVSSLTAGTLYNFKIVAVNKYGVGPDSNSISVMAGQKPDPAAAGPIVTLTGMYVQITWDAATDNHVPVTAYKVQIQAKDSSYSEQLTDCDGSKSATVTARSCLVPMVSLRVTPFNLEYLDKVIVKIAAYNARGWSSDYPLNDATVAP